MPILFIFNGLRFYFYSLEHEPIHVHVGYADGVAKFKVDPEIELITNNGLKPRQIREAFNVIEENKEIIITRWNEYFKK